MTTSAAAEQFLDVGGLRTCYLKNGSGIPVVMIHGGSPGACAQVNWGANIDSLADAGFTVYAYDQPGYGHTDSPTDYSIEYRVQHAQAFIEALGLDRFHVIGNSQGSYVAARIALEDPRVIRMVLVASGTLAPPGSKAARELTEKHREDIGGYVPGLENMREITSGTLYNPAAATDEFIRLRYEMSIGTRHETQLKRRKAPRPRAIWKELSGLKPKTLIFWGLHDRGAAVERAVLLLEQLPDAELHVFARSAHWVQRDEADRFNTLVKQFLLEEV